MDEESVRQAFAKQVDAAVTLRDFMASERHSYHVPDKIVDDIEAARQVVVLKQTPSAEQRASLSKAHRDLILVPDTSVTYNGVPPADFWCRRSPWPWSILWLSAAPALFLLLWMNRSLCTNPEAWSFTWHLPVFYAAASASLIWALYVFTGVVTDKKLNHLIGTCYAFTLLALAFSVVPFLSSGNLASNAKAEIGLLIACADGSDATIPQQVSCKSNPPDGRLQWVINIGGLATQQTPSAAPGSFTISGGLVVPLYVIVMALMGSAISMTRRVPEYQRSAMSAQDPMTNVEAREKLVFQIMQVISAPLIAIAAFSIVKPGSISEAVVVGFGSGFASEPILLMIRGLVEKISPTPSAPAGSVAVKVTPSTSTPKPGDAITFNAQVKGAPNTAVTWQLEPNDPASGTITSAGIYTAPQSVAAERDVTVTATSTADRNQLGTAVIKLVPPPIALATPPVPVTVKPNG